MLLPILTPQKDFNDVVDFILQLLDAGQPIGGSIEGLVGGHVDDAFWFLEKVCPVKCALLDLLHFFIFKLVSLPIILNQPVPFHSIFTAFRVKKAMVLAFPFVVLVDITVCVL
jgi:hypothetical protein